MPNILYENQLAYLSSFRTQPDPLIEDIEMFAAENKIPILDWKAAELLELLVTILKPNRVLEIGTAIAYSSIRIARKLRKNAVLDTIEKSVDNITLAKDFIKRSGLSASINLIEGDALAIMPELTKKYELIFLDADKEDYEKLFYRSLSLLKKGSVIFVDNLLWHGYPASTKVPPAFRNSTEFIRDFNKLFTSQSAIHTTILPVGDGVGLGVKV